MSPAILLPILGMPGTLQAVEPAPPDTLYLQELLQRAEELRLWDDPYWHTLLHYKRGLFGLRSLVDDPRFFASPSGKKKPAEELVATLRAFFTPPDSVVHSSATADSSATDAAKHAVCRFPARLEWLTERLGIDRSRLPVPECDTFEDFYATIGPRSASLIFPTSHMNSPASMYGHTLLTIEGSDGSELLSYAVNYSAVTTETVGPIYILKGLLGLYPGYFSIMPYYLKLQQYSDVNDRDIWEYPLRLDERELRRLLAHVYEMEDIYSNYYFFSENCSYDLLFLLDAARPGLDLTDRFGWWVIPLDTIRAVQESGLVTGAVYRPSKSTRIAHLARPLSNAQQAKAVRVALGKSDVESLTEAASSAAEQARVVDLTSEYLQYLHAKGKISKAEYVPRFLQTLRVRSALGEVAEPDDPIPTPARPEHGHRSSRIVLAGGVRDDAFFRELRLRPVYHDLLDASLGFKEGSEIVFLEGVLRYYPRAEELQLERLDAVGITSIAPRTRFFKHTSWKVETGLRRRTTARGTRSLVYGFNTGFGRAHRTFMGLQYALLETDLQVGGPLAGNYSLGGGGSVGLVADPTRWWKLRVLARGIFYRLGEDDDRFTLSIGQGVRLSTNWNLSFEAERSTEHDASIWDATAGLRFFF